jgi:hypothetical protein
MLGGGVQMESGTVIFTKTRRHFLEKKPALYHEIIGNILK